MAVDLVLLGNLLVDDVVHRDGSTAMGEAGGALLYGSLGAALWGARVGIVGVVGSDYPAATLRSLEERGVCLQGARELGGPGLRTWLLYESACRRVIHQLERPTHTMVSPTPDDLPDAYAAARAYHLAPMPGAVQDVWVEHLQQRDALVTLDPYDEIALDDPARWRATFERIGGLFASEDELRAPEFAQDPKQALARLCGGTLRFVAYKRAARGGVLLDCEHDGLLAWRGSGVESSDPTGAGDAFAGGFLAGWIATGRYESALEQGAVSASFAIEGQGARGLLAATPERARLRREEWFGARARA